MRTVLNHPSTEIVVAEVDPQEIVDRGLGFAYCTVAVVTALSGLTTPFGQPVETVLTGVVEPDGRPGPQRRRPRGRLARPGTPRPVVLVGLDPRNALVRAHVARGGTAVVVRPAPDGDRIALLAGETVDGRRAGRPPTRSQMELPQDVASLTRLAAVAAALARDVPLEIILHGVS